MYPRHETEFSSTRCHCVVVYSFKISSAIAPWRHSWLLKIKVVALFLVVSLSLLIGSLPSPNAGSSAFLPARTRGEAGRCSLLDANLQCGRGLHRISDAKPISRNTKTPHAAVSTFPEDGRILNDKCGSCNSKCPYGLNWCSGVCVNKQIESANCGWCGNTCKNNLPCQDGLCGYGEWLYECMSDSFTHAIQTSFLHFGEFLTHTANISSSGKNLQIEFRSRLFAQS